MARYKHIDTNPRLLPVDLSKQLLPGTFEFALNHLLDEEIDLSGFHVQGQVLLFSSAALIKRLIRDTDKPVFSAIAVCV